MLKKTMALAISLMMLMGFSLQASAAREALELDYVSLGDSIAYGMSAEPGESYFNLYGSYLLEEGYSLETGMNLSAPGLDSGGLLEALTDPPTTYAAMVLQAAVAEAEVVTVSIGGNNLLGPVIGAVYGAYGLDPAEDSMEELASAIYTGGEAAYAAFFQTFMASAASTSPGSLGAALADGSAYFVRDWPQIVAAIRELNPDARILALTLYNPVDPADCPELYNLYEALIDPMNRAIRMTRRNVAVVDVHKSFMREPGAVDFILTEWASLSLDPHPTSLGHAVIFERLIRSRNPMSFR